MRRAAVGLAAALILGFAAPGFAQSIIDEIQDEEQPGSQIGIQLGGGQVEAERENGAPIFPVAPFARQATQPMFPVAPYPAVAQPTQPVFPVAPYPPVGQASQSVFPVPPLRAGASANQLNPIDDPDAPIAGDPIDRELPGEGPEDLSGPDDDDSLPE